MPSNPQAFERLRDLADAFVVTEADIAGPILRRVGQTHRKQELRIFSSQGAEGGSGSWPALSPKYAAWKKRFLGGRAGKTLVLSGEMKDRFTKRSKVEYIQQYDKPYIQVGAQDSIAVAHFLGVPPLPKRDMISKTVKQIEELRDAIRFWWTKERLPQILRGKARLEGR